MTTSPNLGITHLQPNSAQPEVVVNTAVDKLDNAANAARAWTITGNTTVTQAQLAEGYLHVLGGAPGAGFSFDLPSGIARKFAVENDTGQTATVQVTGGGGASVAVPAGETRELHSDGADVVGTGGSGGASAFTSLSDAPASYSGQAGKHVAVNGAANALEFVDPATVTALPAFMGAMVRKTADQTAANFNTATALAFDGEIHDSHAFHDTVTNNSRLTIPAGLGINKVVVKASVYISALTAGADVIVQIIKNGIAAFEGAAGQTYEVDAFATQVCNLSTGPVAVSDGDYFEVLLQINGDTSVTITADKTNFSLQVVEIAGGVQTLDVQQETGTAWTLAISHISALVQADNASPIALTVPTNAAVAWPIGGMVKIVQWAAGVVTVSAAGGVNVCSRGNLMDTNGQHAELTLSKVATDEWLLTAIAPS